MSTALRLSKKGYDVTILEKHSTPGGRLNIIEQDGFRFDMGPSFMSMPYELDELFNSVGMSVPIELEELDPLYQVFFEGQDKSRFIYKDLKKLAEEFKDIEPNLEENAKKYLERAGQFFHDTVDKVVKTNFSNKLDYVLKLSRVPLKHLPYLQRNMWEEVEKHFTSEEVKVIFSLVAFFLGSPPFQTPAIYSLLNYTEMKHNGYWKVKGGMYRLRSLTYLSARTADRRSKDLSKVSAMSKLFATDVAMKVTTDVVQIFGGYGYMRDYPVEKMMRDAKILQIYEGTNQIQRNVIGQYLIKESASS